MLEKMYGGSEARAWGEVYYNKSSIIKQLQNFRYNYKDMKAAEDKILKPMGLTFENAVNPMGDFNEKLEELREQLNTIYESKPERMKRIVAEMEALGTQYKSVQDRINEFAADNHKYLSTFLIAPKMDIEVEAVAIEAEVPETQASEAEMATHEIIAPTDNLIIYGREAGAKKILCMAIAH